LESPKNRNINDIFTRLRKRWLHIGNWQIFFWVSSRKFIMPMHKKLAKIMLLDIIEQHVILSQVGDF